MGYNDGGQSGYRDISDQEFQAFMAEHETGATLEEIADFMGLTRARVGQILNKALVKLRTECERRHVELSDIPSRESVWDQM